MRTEVINGSSVSWQRIDLSRHALNVVQFEHDLSESEFECRCATIERLFWLQSHACNGRLTGCQMIGWSVLVDGPKLKTLVTGKEFSNYRSEDPVIPRVNISVNNVVFFNRNKLRASN